MGIQEEEKKVLKLSLQICEIRLVKYIYYTYTFGFKRLKIS